jgi:ribosomal protein L37AE/L43A
MATGRLRELFSAVRQYADERKRPRVCPVCAHEVAQVDRGLYACQNRSCGWQGTTPYRAP